MLVDGSRYRGLERPLTKMGAVLDANAVNGAMTGRRHLRWLANRTRSATAAPMVLDFVGLNGAPTGGSAATRSA